MKSIFLFLSTSFILFSCGTSSMMSSSNLQKRKHRKGIFVKKRGKFKSLSDRNTESVQREVKPWEQPIVQSVPETSVEFSQDETVDAEFQEESAEIILKEEVNEVLEESHQAYLSNRELKKELKKKYPDDKEQRREEYATKKDRLGFIGFVLHFIGLVPLFPLAGIILGAIAVKRIRDEKSPYAGSLKYPLWALIGGIFAFLSSLAVWYAFIFELDLFG